MPHPIYHPAEDSYFLSEIVKKYLISKDNEELRNIRVLDMGTGSGIQILNLVNNCIKSSNITAIDINPVSIKHVKNLNLGIKTIKSNLFSKLSKISKNKKQKFQFDLIIFNPPYLPESKYDKLPDTTGGKKGDETIIRFINKLKNYLVDDGVCFLLTSSLTPEKNWLTEAKTEKLTAKRVVTKNLFQEKLYIWKINSNIYSERHN